MSLEGNGPYQIAKILTEEKLKDRHIILLKEEWETIYLTITQQSHIFGEEQP